MKSLMKTYITSNTGNTGNTSNTGNTGAQRADCFLKLLLVSKFCDIEIINGIFYYII
jgi:hypothetical protein